MKIETQLKLLWVILLPVLAGCLTAQEKTYKFDYKTGHFEAVYHDLRSVKDGNSGENYLEDDWKTLKNELNRKDDYNPKVVSVISKELFQEGDVLSGKEVFQVHCPECFSSQADLFKFLHGDEDGLRWEIINDEIFLILPSGKALVSTNGRMIETENNHISIWPVTTEVFEYRIAEQQSGGESLLKNYLLEK